MIKIVPTSIFIVAILFLAGCSSPKYSVAKNESDVRQGISIDSGYPGCPDCYKVKTYTSSALASYSWMHNESPVDKGQLTGRVYVGITNNQLKNNNIYFLKVDQTNSGVFASGAYVYLIGASGSKKSLNDFEMNNELVLSAFQMKGYGKNKQCQSNIGFSCWWTDYFLLTPATLNQAIDSGQPLTLFIGQGRTVATTDGYNRKIDAVPLGVTLTINSEYLKTFRDELVSRGVQLPSDVGHH
jgi:hypothetical protein